MSWTIIKTEEQYYNTLDRLDVIFHKTNEPKYSDEFDILAMLINKYEEENYPIEEADPIQVIRMKMDYMDLNQNDLIPYFGSKSTVSRILTYQAPLTLRHIWLLSKYLELPIQLLAKPYKIDQWGFKDEFVTKLKANA